MESKDQNWKRITELYTRTLISTIVIFFSNHGQYKQDYQTQGQYINLTKLCELEHELQRELKKHKIRQTLCPSLRTVLLLCSLLLLSLPWHSFPSKFPATFLYTWHFSTDTSPTPILPIVQWISDAVHKWLYSMWNSCHLTVYCLSFSAICSPYYLFHH